MQPVSRKKKGGKRNMQQGDRRIQIVPLWREEPDARLFATAVVEMARQRLLETREAENHPTPPKEGGNG